jgi:hypothetical protein
MKKELAALGLFIDTIPLHYQFHISDAKGSSFPVFLGRKT